MSTIEFLTTAWNWNALILLLCAAASIVYFFAVRTSGRIAYFIAALVVFLLALVSPLSVLADGYLFSAHMAQHILLLLVIPALLLMSLPASTSLPIGKHPLIGWTAGVGAMWVWHVPTFCNAATASRAIFAFQATSLLIAGTLFWWQVIAPQQADRLSSAGAIAYLFVACTACSVLGIIVTFAPRSVCPVFLHPANHLRVFTTLRNDWGLTSDRDQQLGGLLMWVPMCVIYAGAILAQLARWHSTPAPGLEKQNA